MLAPFGIATREYLWACPPHPNPASCTCTCTPSYSLLEGALTIARLAELAKKDRQPALALTDTDNMFGALEFSEKMASAGIQPIIGCALGVDFGDQEKRGASGWARHGRASCFWPRARRATAA